MGSWGVGPFDNDDARYFLGDLADEPTAAEVVDRISDAMREVLDSGGYVEVPVMARALSAAGVVAVSLVADVLPDADTRDEIDALAVEPDNTVIRLAQATFDRALDGIDNEWFERWDEAGRLSAVEAAFVPYREAVAVVHEDRADHPVEADEDAAVAFVPFTEADLDADVEDDDHHESEE